MILKKNALSPILFMIKSTSITEKTYTPSISNYKSYTILFYSNLNVLYFYTEGVTTYLSYWFCLQIEIVNSKTCPSGQYEWIVNSWQLQRKENLMFCRDSAQRYGALLVLVQSVTREITVSSHAGTQPLVDARQDNLLRNAASFVLDLT
jgi:hypothetical protein